MSENGITGGDWEVRIIKAVHGDTEVPIICSNGMQIAAVLCGPRAQAFAIAHLMAAAPKMRDALELCANLLRTLIQHPGSRLNMRTVMFALKGAETKATEALAATKPPEQVSGT